MRTAEGRYQGSGAQGRPARKPPRVGILRFVKLLQAEAVLESLARVASANVAPVRVGLVQHAWTEDAAQLIETLRDGIRTAAEAGATIVFLPELTLSRYPADTLPQGTPSATAEDLDSGPTIAFARAAAADFGVHVHASLYERAPATDSGTDGTDRTDDGLGFNTAVVVAPSGEIVAACTTTADELAIARCDLDLCNSYKTTTFNFARHREPEQYRLIVERKGAIAPD